MINLKCKLYVLLATLFFSLGSSAVPLTPLRNFVLFPVKTDRKLPIDEGKIWWEMHNQLTKSQRFLVATFEFMKEKDVFQPRGGLIVSDSIILGRLLGADILVTSEIRHSRYSVIFYDARSGLEVWKRVVKLNPAFGLQKQMLKVSPQILRDFEKSLPFLGTVKRLSKNKFKVFTGVNHNLNVGSELDFISVKTTGATPVLNHNYSMYSLGAGVVSEVHLDYVISEGSLGRQKNKPSVFARKSVNSQDPTGKNLKLNSDGKEVLNPEEDDSELIEPITERKKLWLYTMAAVLLSILLI